MRKCHSNHLLFSGTVHFWKIELADKFVFCHLK